MHAGCTPIDDYKILFHFKNEEVKFVRNNVEKKQIFPEIAFSGIHNLSLEDGIGVTMYGKSIIPGDNSISDDFYVHLPFNTKDVDITWKLLSRHYSCEGTLKIIMDIGYVDKIEYDKEKVGETCISDYIEKVDITD